MANTSGSKKTNSTSPETRSRALPVAGGLALTEFLPDLTIGGPSRAVVPDAVRQTGNLRIEVVHASDMSLNARLQTGHSLVRNENGFVLGTPDGSKLKVKEDGMDFTGNNNGIKATRNGIEIVCADQSMIGYEKSGVLFIWKDGEGLEIHGVNSLFQESLELLT